MMVTTAPSLAPDRTSELVRFVDLREQTSLLRQELDAAIGGVLDRCDFVLGDEVDALEAEFAAYCGVAYGVGVDSGFSALELALRAVEIGPGDEVITQANTFIATVSAVMAVGATPVLVDCLADGSIDVAAVAAAITPRTRAILPVHLFGKVCDMPGILAVAERAGAIVIEDACQAHGAVFDGRRAGSFGAAAAFSFYPGKNLGAFGDAGMLVSGDPSIAEAVRRIRHYGQREKYRHDLTPLNRRLDTIQAAVLRVKLRHLDEWNSARIGIAERYLAGLAGLPFDLPSATARGRNVYHLFVIGVDERDRVREELSMARIETGIHYPIPLHMQPALTGLGYQAGDFPETERQAARMISLPMYPELRPEAVDRVCAVLADSQRR
jgi:dTDP-4-amino-4,6-dideoxygalactose transaminase